MTDETRTSGSAADTPSGTSDTKTRLLDTAEALFAERGFTETSLRALTHAAGVNIAAVNYHFGSKDKLMRAVFERRIGPVNAERLAMLDAAEASSSGGAASVESIVHAFVAPPLRLGASAERRQFMRVMARGLFEPGAPLASASGEIFGEVFSRFALALRRALPDLSNAALGWGFRFMLGTLIQTLMLDADHVHVVLRKHLQDHDEHALAHAHLGDDVTPAQTHIVTFVSAGLRALASDSTSFVHERDGSSE